MSKTGSGSDAKPSPGTSQKPSASANCVLHLTAKLCVKIKGDDIDVGTQEGKEVCADTPPIPIELQGDKAIIKGSDFPDIPVQVKLPSGNAPMTINAKGKSDGSKNIGQGFWTPDGEIEIHNFSFFFNILGLVGEIPGLNLTTNAARKLPQLPALSGSPADASGKITLVTGTTLGSLSPAADKFLLGASMQVVFAGTLDPTLSECSQNNPDQKRQITITKIRLNASGKLSEETLPEGNILEISQGTFIAQGPQDIGSDFETTAYFKATNNGDKPVNILIPGHLGSFYLTAEGKSQRSLSPKASFKFKVSFHPTTADTPKPGPIRQSLRLGIDAFYLSGIAMAPQGRTSVDKIDDNGKVQSANVDTLVLSPLSVPASSVKDFFKCQKIKCGDQDTITQCQKCSPPKLEGCNLLPINTSGKPVGEVSELCKPIQTDDMPMMTIDLAGSSQLPIKPSKQTVTIQNTGIANLDIKKIWIEELAQSKSVAQFRLLQEAILVGDKPEKAVPAIFPVTLTSQSVFVSVTYLPTDLIGFDGKQATTGVDAIDRATLKIETSTGIKSIPLIGKTRIQDVPDLKVYFHTATGRKDKANDETFPFEEVTANTEDLAIPVYLKLADSANNGLRISDISLAGKDASFFEWLDTMDKVSSRQPASGHGKRCSISTFDSTGHLTDERFDLQFVSLGNQGFDLKPGAYTLDSMPLFGCVNFHRGEAQDMKQRLFQTDMVVTAIKLDALGKPEKNSDNTYKQTRLTIHLVAAIDPLRGKMVLRIPQTLGAFFNPQAPILTAGATKKEVELLTKEGKTNEKELFVMLGAVILDPFDEMEITDQNGSIVSKPGDGITAVVRTIDTHPASINYEEEDLYDYTGLFHDSSLPTGKQGVFYDYDFPEHPLPSPLKVNGWRIFTGALSYPGPLDPRAPINREECEAIDPCSPEGLRKFTESGLGPDGKGACAFFYVSGGRYDSPAFQATINNRPEDFCASRDKPQDLIAFNTGHYSVDGSLTLENLGLRFWGPTYFHNPGGPLGNKPPMDEVFHSAFTTEILKPQSNPKDYNMLPDEKLDFSKQEHKVNLTDTTLGTSLCLRNTFNRTIGGQKYSSWRYISPLITKDEAGEIPAGCPEPGTPFTGGTAFFRGRRIDPATSIFSLATSAKFGSREDLSLAFQNVPIFFALNGWICDPQGDEKNFEGALCFSPKFNERDAKAQISIIGDEK